jgi:hypothetical protein
MPGQASPDARVSVEALGPQQAFMCFTVRATLADESVKQIAPGDLWAHAARAEQSAVLVGVIAAVAVARVGALARPAALADDRADRVDQRLSWVTPWRSPPVTETASGAPDESTIAWCLLPARPRSTGEGPVRSRAFRRSSGDLPV